MSVLRSDYSDRGTAMARGIHRQGAASRKSYGSGRRACLGADPPHAMSSIAMRSETCVPSLHGATVAIRDRDPDALHVQRARGTEPVPVPASCIDEPSPDQSVVAKQDAALLRRSWRQRQGQLRVDGRGVLHGTVVSAGRSDLSLPCRARSPSPSSVSFGDVGQPGLRE